MHCHPDHPNRHHMLRLHWIAAARRGHRFGHEFAEFDDAFGDGTRRRFDGSDLRLLILHLLEAEPRHGYDIIKEVEALSDGAYSPSPGVVYPALTYLEEAEFVAGSTEPNRKSYTITDAGRAHLEAHREELDIIIGKLRQLGRHRRLARERFERRIHKMRKYLGAEDGIEMDAKAGAQTDLDIPGVIDEVNDARRALKRAIRAAIAEGEPSQRRLAEILNKAAAEIGADDIDIG